MSSLKVNFEQLGRGTKAIELFCNCLFYLMYIYVSQICAFCIINRDKKCVIHCHKAKSFGHYTYYCKSKLQFFLSFSRLQKVFERASFVFVSKRHESFILHFCFAAGYCRQQVKNKFNVD